MNEAMRLPLLICLNLQRRHADPTSDSYVPRTLQVLPAVIACMHWARRNNLELVHVHSAENGSESSLPMRGCEPLVTEYLLRSPRRSFLSHPHFSEGHLKGREAIVVGFTSDSDCVAAACDASRLGARIAFVSDAVSASNRSGQPPEIVDAVVNTLLSDMAVLTVSSDLLENEFQRSSECSASRARIGGKVRC